MGRHRLPALLIVAVAVAVAIAACGPAPASTASLAVSPTPPAPIEFVAPVSQAPSAQPTVASLTLQCSPGELMQGSIIDYANEATGPLDIVAATRAFRGVRPTDLVVRSGPSTTIVIRDGRAIWRGDWFPGASGFLLGGSTSCTDAGINN